MAEQNPQEQEQKQTLPNPAAPVGVTVAGKRPEGYQQPSVPAFEMDEEAKAHYEQLLAEEQERAEAFRKSVEYGLSVEEAKKVHKIEVTPEGEKIWLNENGSCALQFNSDHSECRFVGDRNEFTPEHAKLMVSAMMRQGISDFKISDCSPEQASMLIAEIEKQGGTCSEVFVIDSEGNRIKKPTGLLNRDMGDVDISKSNNKAHQQMFGQIRQDADKRVAAGHAELEKMIDNPLFSNEQKAKLVSLKSQQSQFITAKAVHTVERAYDRVAMRLGFENQKQLQEFVQKNPQKLNNIQKIADLEMQSEMGNQYAMRLKNNRNELSRVLAEQEAKGATETDRKKRLENIVSGMSEEELSQRQEQVEKITDKINQRLGAIDQTTNNARQQLQQTNSTIDKLTAEQQKVAKKVSALTRKVKQSDPRLISMQAVIEGSEKMEDGATIKLDKRQKAGLLGAIQRYELSYKDDDVQKLQEALKTGNYETIKQTVLQITEQKAMALQDQHGVKEIQKALGIEKPKEPAPNSPQPSAGNRAKPDNNPSM